MTFHSPGTQLDPAQADRYVCVPLMGHTDSGVTLDPALSNKVLTAPIFILS